MYEPNGKSQRRLHAAIAPAEAPDMLLRSRWGAYFLKHPATPTWYIPKNPHPANDRFMVDKLGSSQRSVQNVRCSNKASGTSIYRFFLTSLSTEKQFHDKLPSPLLGSSLMGSTADLLILVVSIDNNRRVHFRPTSYDVHCSNKIDWLLFCGVVVTPRLYSTAAPLAEIILITNFLSLILVDCSPRL